MCRRLTEPAQPANVASEMTVQSSPERPHRPMVEKPRRPSVEREMKNSPEKSGKSLPPPPPRRFFPSPSGPGLTTGRSGEVIFTTRKEAATAQVCDSIVGNFSSQAAFPDSCLQQDNLITLPVKWLFSSVCTHDLVGDTVAIYLSQFCSVKYSSVQVSVLLSPSG